MANDRRGPVTGSQLRANAREPIPEVSLRQLSYVCQLEQRIEALEAADRRATVAEAALIHLLTVVVTALDPDPAYWAGYFIDPAHRDLAERLADEYDSGHPTIGGPSL
jgi:hypothetical protein